MRAPRVRKTNDIRNRSVRTRTQRDDTNNKRQQAPRAQPEVLLLKGAASSEEAEPHDGGDPEAEAGHEQRRGEGQQVGEDGDGFGDDPRDDGEDDDEDDPGRPAGDRVDVAQDAVLEHAAVDVAQGDGGVDAAGDEDDGERDAECNLRNQGSCGEERGGSHVLADEGVAQRAGERVDADLDDAAGPDGLHVLVGGVHFVHEAKLADGEAEGEDDVGNGDEGLGEGEVFLGPRAPVDGGHPAGLVAGLDACRDDGDADCDQDGGEVDVAQDGDFREGWRDGEDQQNDSGDGGKGDGAHMAAIDVDERDTSSQSVGADHHNEFKHQGGAEELVAKAAEQQTTCIGVGRDFRELEFDLADDVAGEDGDSAEADGEQNAGEHAEGCVGLGQGKCAECDCLNDGDNRQTFPTQAVEVSIAVFGDLLCPL